MNNHAQDEEIERWLVTWKYTRVRFRYSCSSAGLDKADTKNRDKQEASAQTDYSRRALPERH